MSQDAASREIDALANMGAATEHRLDSLEERLPGLIRSAVQSAVSDGCLSKEEREWVRLAIKREARSEKFRDSVIDKTTSGFVLAFVLALCGGAWLIVKEWFVLHGWKP